MFVTSLAREAVHTYSTMHMQLRQVISTLECNSLLLQRRLKAGVSATLASVSITQPLLAQSILFDARGL